MRYLLAALALVAIAAAVKVRRVGESLSVDECHYVGTDPLCTTHGVYWSEERQMAEPIVGMPTTYFGNGPVWIGTTVDWDAFFDTAGRQN